MLNIRCPKKSPTSLRWVSAKLLQILENLHSRQDKCFSSVLNSSYSLFFSSCFILSFFSSILHYTLAPIFFFMFLSPLELSCVFPIIPLFVFSSFLYNFFSLLCFPLFLYPTPLWILRLSLLSHSSAFLSASFTLHQEVHTSDESDCDDDLVPKTGMEVHTHTHTHTHTHIHTLTLTLYVCRKVCVFTTKLDSFWLQQLGNDSDVQNVTILVWAENMNCFICNKQCCHTAF